MRQTAELSTVRFPSGSSLVVGFVVLIWADMSVVDVLSRLLVVEQKLTIYDLVWASVDSARLETFYRTDQVVRSRADRRSVHVVVHIDLFRIDLHVVIAHNLVVTMADSVVLTV